MTTHYLVLLFFVCSIFIIPQSVNPDDLLKRVADSYEKIQDYEVDVTIKVDVKFLKIPERKAKIFYKYPDKIFIDSDGFAMLPKQGLSFSPSSFIDKPHSAIFDREENLNGINTIVIKVIPSGSDSEVILSTLWIDTSRNLIMKIDSSTKQDGSVTIEFQYLKTSDNFYMPSTMIFSFDIDKVRFPSGVTGEIDSENTQEKDDNKNRNTGKVTISYSNYKVNQGLSDDLFKEESKTK